MPRLLPQLFVICNHEIEYHRIICLCTCSLLKHMWCTHNCISPWWNSGVCKHVISNTCTLFVAGGLNTCSTCYMYNMIHYIHQQTAFHHDALYIVCMHVNSNKCTPFVAGGLNTFIVYVACSPAMSCIPYQWVFGHQSYKSYIFWDSIACCTY